MTVIEIKSQKGNRNMKINFHNCTFSHNFFFFFKKDDIAFIEANVKLQVLYHKNKIKLILKIRSVFKTHPKRFKKRNVFSKESNLHQSIYNINNT